MRAITLVVLLVLNLIALASIVGWLGEPGEQGEGQRLAQQLNPERIVLANERAAPAEETQHDARVEANSDESSEAATPQAETEPPVATAVAELHAADRESNDAPDEVTTSAPPPPANPAVCLAWAGLGNEEARQLSTALNRAGATVRASTSELPSSWWVHLPPQGGREQADRQAQNLRTRGVKDLFIVQDAGPNQYAISLGVFKTETRARVLLNELRKQGVTQAILSPRLSTSHRIEARFPPTARAAVDGASRSFNAQRSSCTTE